MSLPKDGVANGAARSGDSSGRRDQGVRAASHTLDVLDYLATRQGEAGVTEVGQALGVHKSTASRLLATMEARRYVSRNGTTGKYSLGMRLVELSKVKLDRLDLRAHARPFLEELVSNTGETSHLAILDRGEVVYIDKADTPQTLMMRSRIGYRISPHCTALGKAILAALPDDVVNALMSEKGLPRFTPNTITEALPMKEHLRRVRAQGFAIDDEEHEAGIRCAAAAIMDHAGRVAGAISVSGPTFRVSRQRIEEFGMLVRDACHRLSSSLGSGG